MHADVNSRAPDLSGVELSPKKASSGTWLAKSCALSPLFSLGSTLRRTSRHFS